LRTERQEEPADGCAHGRSDRETRARCTDIVTAPNAAHSAPFSGPSPRLALSNGTAGPRNGTARSEASDEPTHNHTAERTSLGLRGRGGSRDGAPRCRALDAVRRLRGLLDAGVIAGAYRVAGHGREKRTHLDAAGVCGLRPVHRAAHAGVASLMTLPLLGCIFLAFRSWDPALHDPPGGKDALARFERESDAPQAHASQHGDRVRLRAHDRRCLPLCNGASQRRMARRDRRGRWSTTGGTRHHSSNRPRHRSRSCWSAAVRWLSSRTAAMSTGTLVLRFRRLTDDREGETTAPEQRPLTECWVKCGVRATSRHQHSSTNCAAASVTTATGGRVRRGHRTVAMLAVARGRATLAFHATRSQCERGLDSLAPPRNRKRRKQESPGDLEPRGAARRTGEPTLSTDRLAIGRRPRRACTLGCLAPNPIGSRGTRSSADAVHGNPSEKE
jgi:hypothetical protein